MNMMTVQLMIRKFCLYLLSIFSLAYYFSTVFEIIYVGFLRGDVEVAEPEKDGKKKVWQDKKERWSHDRFNDNEQAPKSRSELIAIYGYDIRNEEGPPRARRRRRYG